MIRSVNGEFVFLSASSGVVQQRTCMVGPLKEVTNEEALEWLRDRQSENSRYLNDDEQSEQGRMFEALAEITDDDGALAEMQDLGLL